MLLGLCVAGRTADTGFTLCRLRGFLLSLCIRMEYCSVHMPDASSFSGQKRLGPLVLIPASSLHETTAQRQQLRANYKECSYPTSGRGPVAMTSCPPICHLHGWRSCRIPGPSLQHVRTPELSGQRNMQLYITGRNHLLKHESSPRFPGEPLRCLFHGFRISQLVRTDRKAGG